MNLCKPTALLLLLCLLFTQTVVEANDEASLVPSEVMRTENDSSTEAFDASTMTTAFPTDNDTCTDNPNWIYVHEYMAGWARETEIRGCNHDGVECCHKGNLGYARDFCCKCLPADYECKGDPDDDGFPMALEVLTCVGFVFITLLLFNMFTERELYQIRQTMTARRQQQRENHEQGLAEEERNNARYQLFASRFHFQEVFPDKSNISVDGFRRSSIKLGGEDFAIDEEAKTDIVDGDDSEVALESSRHSAFDIRKLSGFWRLAHNDDCCCICLEPYLVGETICAPITKECSHVFHEGCIHEWIKRGNDVCPLCRVELLKE